MRVGLDMASVEEAEFVAGPGRPEGEAMFADGLWVDEGDEEGEEIERLDEQIEADADCYGSTERELWRRPALVGGDGWERSSGSPELEVAKLRVWGSPTPWWAGWIRFSPEVR